MDGYEDIGRHTVSHQDLKIVNPLHRLQNSVRLVLHFQMIGMTFASDLRYARCGRGKLHVRDDGRADIVA